MAARSIVLYETNEAELRQESEPVVGVTRQVTSLVSDLKDTLRLHPNGVGLAAPQVGVHQRVAIVRFGTGGSRKPGPPIASSTQRLSRLAAS